MESKSSEKPGQRIGDPDIASKIIRGKVATLCIPENRLTLYLDAASASGFEVKKIAEEGEKFPSLKGKAGEQYSGQERSVSDSKVQGKGYIAVSIEKPEDSKDHTPFWEKLQTIEEYKKLSSSPKPTTKPLKPTGQSRTKP